MKRTTFAALPIGTRFKHEGRVYLKLGMNLARDTDQKRVIFPSDLEVKTLKRNGQRSGT
jgi:hypothetical protein